MENVKPPVCPACGHGLRPYIGRFTPPLSLPFLWWGCDGETDCPGCDGRGWWTVAAHAHDCDGDCRGCPVPEQEQCGSCRGTGTADCHYCTHPVPLPRAMIPKGWEP